MATSLPPIVLFPGGHRRPDSLPPLLNTQSEDIRGALTAAASAARIPLTLVLACAIAESSLDPRAERWGGASSTRDAKAAIAAGDRASLRDIISRAWADVSFGYGQRVVLYHYTGDRSQTVENVLQVRDYVFAHPEEDLRRMAEMLAGNLARARAGNLAPCDGDELLGALIVYNSGRLPLPQDPWWQTWSENVANYRRALARARKLLGG